MSCIPATPSSFFQVAMPISLRHPSHPLSLDVSLLPPRCRFCFVPLIDRHGAYPTTTCTCLQVRDVGVGVCLVPSLFFLGLFSSWLNPMFSKTRLCVRSAVLQCPASLCAVPCAPPSRIGPFRFLRMRRVLQALDDVRSDRAAARSTSGVAVSVNGTSTPAAAGAKARSRRITRLCGAALSTKAVGFVLLAARIILFVLCSASIILMFEFPCEMWVLEVAAS